jgi:hypothetical protein
MKKTDLITKLLERAAYEDTLGPTSEGAILREAAACILEQELQHSRQAVIELLERLNRGIQPR